MQTIRIANQYVLASDVEAAAKRLVESGERLCLHNARLFAMGVAGNLTRPQEDRLGRLVLAEAESMAA